MSDQLKGSAVTIFHRDIADAEAILQTALELDDKINKRVQVIFVRPQEVPQGDPVAVWDELEAEIKTLRDTLKALPFVVVACCRCGKRAVAEKDPDGRLKLKQIGWDDDVVHMASTYPGEVDHTGYFCPDHIEDD